MSVVGTGEEWGVGPRLALEFRPVMAEPEPMLEPLRRMVEAAREAPPRPEQVQLLTPELLRALREEPPRR